MSFEIHQQLATSQRTVAAYRLLSGVATAAVRLSLMVLALAVPSVAHAQTVLDAEEWTELCSHALSAEARFALPLWRATTQVGSPVVVVSAAQAAPEGFMRTSALLADATGAAQPLSTYSSLRAVAPDIPVRACTDRMVTAVHARDYARARAAWVTGTYVAELPGTALELRTEGQDEVVLALPSVLDVVGGAFRVALPESVELGFAASDDDVEQWLASAAMDAVTARVTFTLAAQAQPSTSLCLVAPDGGWVVPAALVSVELVESLTMESYGRVMAASWVESYVRDVAAEASGDGGQTPTASVTSISAESAFAMEESETTILQLLLETLATDCYLAGLHHNGGLRGALVVHFDVAPNGDAMGVRLGMDALQCDIVTECMVDSVSRLQLPIPADVDGVAVRATLAFHPSP
ncbi:MAG: hypothetical protein ACI81R_002482 [Bradymonadia bacterium]|jgi:hypothetical protein